MNEHSLDASKSHGYPLAIRDIFPAPTTEAVDIGPKDGEEFIRVDSGRFADLALLMEMAALVMDAEQPA